MHITIGSKNQIKIDAVQELLGTYDMFKNATFEGVDVPHELYGNPKTLDDTIKWACDRAKDAFNTCDYSFGIESGMMLVPYTKTGYMNIVACAIYDGTEFHIGISSAFEYPKRMTELIIHGSLDASQACKEAGLTNHEKIGTAGGVISILTKGKLDRMHYTQQAITMAVLHLENPELY